MLDNFENIDDLNSEEAAFLNDSWAKMSGMLEEEMPVGTAPLKESTVNYRRYLTLLLLLVFMGGGLWFGTPERNRPSDTDQVNEEWTTSDIERMTVLSDLVLSENEKVIEEEVSNENKEELDDLIAEKSIVQVMPGEQKSTEQSKVSSDDLASLKNDRESTILPAQPPTPKGEHPPAQRSKELELSKINGVVKQPKLIAVQTDRTVSKTIDEKLELNTTQDKISAEPYTTKSLVIPMKKTKKWTYGLMAGIQQEKINQGFGGFNVGLLLSRKMARNFTLETGLNYSLTQFNNTMINNSPKEVAFNQPEQNQASGIEEELTLTYLPSDANESDAIQMGTASWLSIPLLLTYQPNRTWRVNMGVEYSQLLQAQEQKIINNESGAKGRITDLIAENNISALTGLTWFPRENLGIDIRYIFGFTDLSKSNPKFIEQTDTRAALQWSLVYYFNPKN